MPELTDLAVVTPNENAARALGVRHLSLETMARLSLTEGRRAANPVQVSRLSRAAVERALGAADAAGVARTLLGPVREVFRSGAEIESEPDSPRARRVFEVARTYRRLLREHGLVDPSESLWIAAESSPGRRALLLWGYQRLGVDEAAFLDAVSGDGSIVYLPYAEDPLFDENLESAQGLRETGWEVDIHPAQAVWAVRDRVEVAAHAYPNREAEVRGVLARVKRLLKDDVSPEEIVIVARDDADHGPSVLAVAREYEVPVQALYQVPLADTRLGSWLGLLLEASSSGFPFEETARLLRHPLGPGLPEEALRAARSGQASGAARWAEFGVDVSGLGLARWPERDSRSGWVTRVEHFLKGQGIEEKVSAWRREAVALSRLEEALGWLSSPDEEIVARERFLEELEELLYLATTPAHLRASGVALHTPLALFGASYRHVFVLGLVEGGFPALVGEDAALDFHERRRLREDGVHLELAAERARRERLSFRELLRVPTESLVLSHPALADRREALPSPYFGLLGLEPVPPEPAPLASREEARRVFLRAEPELYTGDAVLDLARERWRVEMRREGAEPFDAHDGALGVPVAREGSFSVSELGDLARCGFRWWSGRVLRISEPEGGESAALIGSINHTALELAVGRALEDGANGERLREAVLGHLERAFEESERHHSAHRRIRSWRLRREDGLRRLRRAVEGGEFLLPGAEVVGTEVRFEGEWRGFPVKGRLDRVDRTAGGAVLVDYKSGAGSSLPRPDFQLTVYEEAAGAELVPGSPVAGTYYYSLSKGERIRIGRPDEEERERVAEGMRSVLEAGHLTPDALQKDPSGKVCEFCSFDLVCRHGPRLRRKPRWEGEGAPGAPGEEGA